MILARGPQPSSVVTCERLTGARYGIVDLAFGCCEGTDASVRLPLPTSKGLDLQILYVGCSLFSTSVQSGEIVKVLMRVGSELSFV